MDDAPLIAEEPELAASAPATLRQWALSLLTVPTLEAKLAPPPPGLSDEDPGPPLRLPGPARPPELAFSQRRVKMPRPGALVDPHKRAVALHRFANHELQAVEIMAWALLAFPDAPPALRRGVAGIIAEEQLHLGLYRARMEALGLTFGALPVNDYFWTKAHGWETILHYLAAMALTFEAANLDFAQDFEAAFRAAGDDATAEVVARVHADEIRHVRFGMVWLRRLKDPAATPWDAFVEHLVYPLHPARARGKRLDLDARRAAGMDDAFLGRLLDIHPSTIARELGRGDGRRGP